MTGGDFALIKSVEFFEDFAEGCRRQAAAPDVGEGDTFVAITEGGETSSVLGTLQYAAEHGAKCFLVFNNPADLLRKYLDRYREAIDNPRVTVLDIYCGSMSLAGSTRMQATSSEQLLGSCALEAAEGELAFSDWKAAGTGDRPGRRLLLNYVSIKPYYIESEDELEQLKALSVAR